MPLSLGWNYRGTHFLSLEEYEGKTGIARTRQELALDSKERERILRQEWGYSFKELHEASEVSIVAKQKRTETLLLDSNRRLRRIDKFREHSVRVFDRMLHPNRQEIKQLMIEAEARQKFLVESNSTPTRLRRRRSDSVPNLESTELPQPHIRRTRSSSFSQRRSKTRNDDLSAGALSGWARKHDFQEMQSCLYDLKQRQLERNSDKSSDQRSATTILDEIAKKSNNSITLISEDSKATIISTIKSQRASPKNYHRFDDKLNCELKKEQRKSSIKPSLSRSLSLPSLLLIPINNNMPLSKHFSIGNALHKKPLLSNSAYVESWSRKHDISTTLQLCLSDVQQQHYLEHNSNTSSSAPTAIQRVERREHNEFIPFLESHLGLNELPFCTSTSCILKLHRSRSNSTQETQLTNSWSTSASLEVWRRKHDLEANKLCLPN